jgi:hypothetical protein
VALARDVPFGRAIEQEEDGDPHDGDREDRADPDQNPLERGGRLDAVGDPAAHDGEAEDSRKEIPSVVHAREYRHRCRRTSAHGVTKLACRPQSVRQ